MADRTPSESGPVAKRLEDKLRAAFAPLHLAIIDESARHRGHAGARPEGETHFRVEMVSAIFCGKSRLERQRLVYAALAEELRERVHALVLELRAPEET
ncbi:MAG: BolA family transcriptional regulator [Alphaproteobacteria bacterium]|nr:MAG: BolA family transcriptional regulator [Alphaproteobacteria bacterium]